MKRALTIILVLVCTGSLLAQSIIPTSSVDRASQTEMKNLRSSLIESIAREFKFKDPYAAVNLVPAPCRFCQRCDHYNLGIVAGVAAPRDAEPNERPRTGASKPGRGCLGGSQPRPTEHR